MSSEITSKYCYDYPRPALTTDCAVFTRENNRWQLLLIQRKHDPYKNCWALPGGFLDMNETVEQCARRELKEETGLEVEELKELFTASKVDRDPRGRVISVIFSCEVDKNKISPKAADDALSLKWFYIDELADLAFDHAEVIPKVISALSLQKR